MMHVKLRGITNAQDARVAIDAGADMLGFIFYPPSPRYITPEGVREIVHAHRPVSNVQFVGAFVNEALDHIRARIV